MKRSTAMHAALRIALASAFMCACSADNPDTTEPPGTTHDDGTALVNIISAAPIPDTIQAIGSIVARVTKADGSPRANSEVVFSVVVDSGSLTSSMRVGGSIDTTWTSSVSTKTNENGSASVRITYAQKPGVAHIRVVSVPYQVVQTVAYSTLAGAPNKVSVSPADTMVIAGTKVQYKAVVTDRFNTILSDTATFSTDGDAASVTPRGEATGKQSGLPTIRARVTRGGKTTEGTTSLFVVPTTPIAWVSGGVVVGSLASVSVSKAAAAAVNSVAWKPGADIITFSSNSTLISVTTNGAQAAPPITGIANADWPEYSPDGQWIYFSGEFDGVQRVVREHADGTGFEVVTPNDTAYAPSVSPDGNRVVFASNSNLKVIDLNTRIVSTIASKALPYVNGVKQLYSPRWSPDGTRIAYSNGGDDNILVLNLNTGSTSAFGLSLRASPGFGWSPDSQWLIAYNSINIPNAGEIIHVATGKGHAVPWISRMPVWKR